MHKLLISTGLFLPEGESSRFVVLTPPPHPPQEFTRRLMGITITSHMSEYRTIEIPETSQIEQNASSKDPTIDLLYPQVYGSKETTTKEKCECIFQDANLPVPCTQWIKASIT
jgi:hypothetical protein